MSPEATTVRRLAEPLADAAGVDLVDVEVRGRPGSQKVLVRVDRKGGVDLDTCQQVSRSLSGKLDEADPFSGRYTLEVTSPGVDHPLTDRRAFERVEGRPVLVHRDEGGGRITQIRGTVAGATDDAVVLATGDEDEQSLRVPYAEIVKATQSLPW
jgi:ribosome maturation factor RimP